MIITFLLAAALFYLASYVELKIIKYAIFAYCLWSFWRYVMLMKKKRMPEISRFYSGITVVEKEITIHYSIPRFLLLIPVNLMLFLWKNIFLRWDDSVLIDVKTKDGTIVCIKL